MLPFGRSRWTALWLAALAVRLPYAAIIGDPDQLCPKDMPSEWRPRCLAGHLLWGPFGKVNKHLMPEVGNGHLARKVQSPSLFAAGLYNGDAQGQNGRSSHRATLPPYNVWLKFSGSSDEDDTPGAGYALDMEKAVFMERSFNARDAADVQVDQRWYAPLHEPSMLVHELHLLNKAEEERLVSFGQWGDIKSPSLWAKLVPQETLLKHKLHAWNTHAIEGKTKVGEVGNTTSFALVANRIKDTVKLLPGGRESLYALIVVVTSLNSTDPPNDALSTLSKYTEDDFALMPELFRVHAEAWQQRSEQGRVEVDGDLSLAQVINSSLYYIRSSIRDDWPHGLSPGGLSSNGYSGHSFWDMETWMYPPLLMLEPKSAKSILQYRFDRIRPAQQKARQCGSHGPGQSYCPPGYQDRVAPEAMMFPWESAHTGADVQFWDGKLGPWGRYEQHITGDIALAARQYWYVTHDREWLRDVGLPLANGTASFYVARVEWIPNTNLFDYNQVMGPDEYSWPVDNSGYTNAIASIALKFAVEAAVEFGMKGHVYDDFMYKANGLLPPSWGGPPPGRQDLQGGYHPEYQNFPKNPRNPRAKQADAILLAYPLGVVDNKVMIANDLDFYERITDPTGPAMTWSMFAIGWLSVGNFQRSIPHFQKGYHNAQPPFGVWTEYPRGATSFPGCVNFITGAGGFLQSLIFGTSGMRIKKDGLYFSPPPPAATGTPAKKLILHSFHYLGWRLRQEVSANEASYELLGGYGPLLCLTAQGGNPQMMHFGRRIVHKRTGLSTIKICHRSRKTKERRLRSVVLV